MVMRKDAKDYMTLILGDKLPGYLHAIIFATIIDKNALYSPSIGLLHDRLQTPTDVRCHIENWKDEGYDP